ncbi:MAG TPA: hypothetical protein PK728_11740 [Bacillota bacterium]|nr:hypothetical protein [Bacillota bacterium]
MDFEKLSYEALVEVNKYMFNKIRTNQYNSSSLTLLPADMKEEAISMQLLIEFAKEISKATIVKYHEELTKKLKEKGITLD